MRSSVLRLALSFALLVLWCLFIFSMSAADGTRSQSFSDGFSSLLLDLLSSLHVEFGTSDNASAIGTMSFPIRKLAHFSEYVILAFLAINAFARVESRRGRSVSIKAFAFAMVFCVLYAISDELHQLFVPGRSSQAFDVFVDSLGSCFGLVIVFFVHKFYCARKAHKNKARS